MSYYIVFSVLSIVFYSIVYLPQILLIYKNKSSCGISFLMLYVWTQADVLSLLAAILSRLSLNVILLGWYDVATGIFMISFCYYYYPSKSNSFQTLLSILLFTLSNFTLLVISHTITSQQLAGEVRTLQLAGEVIGWLTTFLYLIGRFPQIYINFKSKNVDGLSILMFIYTILGNVCYLLSIITLSIEQSYIESNLPWITTTVVSIVLDVFVICQIKYYKQSQSTQYVNSFQI